MSTQHLPFIEAANYEAFRDLIPDLPATHLEWQARHRAQVRHCRDLHRQANEVKVRPDMYAAWCEREATPPSLDSLDRFAHEEGLPDRQHLTDGTANPWGRETD